MVQDRLSDVRLGAKRTKSCPNGAADVVQRPMLVELYLVIERGLSPAVSTEPAGTLAEHMLTTSDHHDALQSRYGGR